MEKKRKFDVLAWSRLKPLAASRKLFEFLQKARDEFAADFYVKLHTAMCRNHRYDSEVIRRGMRALCRKNGWRDCLVDDLTKGETELYRNTVEGYTQMVRENSPAEAGRMISSLAVDGIPTSDLIVAFDKPACRAWSFDLYDYDFIVAFTCMATVLHKDTEVLLLLEELVKSEEKADKEKEEGGCAK